MAAAPTVTPVAPPARASRATLRGDKLLTERLVANLAGNATRHNVAGGSVEISTAARDGRAPAGWAYPMGARSVACDLAQATGWPASMARRRRALCVDTADGAELVIAERPYGTFTRQVPVTTGTGLSPTCNSP